MTNARDALFSAIATHTLYTNVTAHSHREGVTVFIGIKTYRYGRPGHGVRTDQHVRDVVTDAVTEYTRGRARGQYDPTNGWEILSSGYPVHRGERRFSVWIPKGA